jgi:hypothetical protein
VSTRGSSVTDLPHALGEEAGRRPGGARPAVFPDDPEVAGPPTAADFALQSVDAVERHLDALAR